jgi:hypothetical protein
MIRFILLLASLAWPVTRTHQELIDLAGRKGDITHLYDLYNRAGWVTPQEYGAAADGVTDDAAAIQAALNTGKAVYFPRGVYAVGSAISALDSSVLFALAPARIKYLNTTARLSISGDEWVTVDGLEFEGLSGDSSSYGIEVGGSAPDNVKIRHCKFYRLGVCIYANTTPADPARYFSVERNYFHDCGNCVNVSAFDRSEFIGNISQQATVGTQRAFVFSNISNSVVSENVINGSIAATYNGIILRYDTTQGPYANRFNVISKNRVVNTYEEGISQDQTNRAWRTGGEATGGGAAYLVHAGAGWTVNAFTGYHLLLMDSTGYGQYREIASNKADTIFTTQAWRVNPAAGTRYQVQALMIGNQYIGNEVKNSGRDGILLYGGSVETTIQGNTLTGCARNTDDTLWRGYITAHAVAAGSTRPGANTATDRSPAWNTSIVGNILNMTNSRNGITVAAFLPGEVTNPANYSNFNNLGGSVIGNQIHGIGHIGIKVRFAEQVVVQGNTLSGLDTCVREDSSGVANTVVDNKAYNCGVAVEARGTGSVLVHTGTGSPETAVRAAPGSEWRRTDGGASTSSYRKESGIGATGWVGK